MRPFPLYTPWWKSADAFDVSDFDGAPLLMCRRSRTRTFRPSVVPPGPPRQNDRPRVVLICSRPVGFDFVGHTIEAFGRAGGATTRLPRVLYHWALRVGGYYHELAVHKRCLAYRNGHAPDLAAWSTAYPVGTTTLNDQALVDAGRAAVAAMRPRYDWYDNNCQTFVIAAFTFVCKPGHERFATIYSKGVPLAGKHDPWTEMEDADGEMEVGVHTGEGSLIEEKCSIGEDAYERL